MFHQEYKTFMSSNPTNHNCRFVNILVGALMQMCAYESSLAKRYNPSGHLDRAVHRNANDTNESSLVKRYNPSGHLDRAVHRNAATASKQSLWRKNELQVLLCSQRAHELWATADAGRRLDFIFSPFNAPTHSFQGPMQEGAKVSSQVRQILGLQMDQEVVRPTFARFHRSPRFCLPTGKVVQSCSEEQEAG